MKQNLKKAIYLAVVLVFALASLTGCTGGAQQQSTASSPAASPAASSSAAASSAPADTSAAQSPVDGKMFTIGITQIAEHPSLDICKTGAVEKLNELGFVEGKNLKIDFKNAQGDISVATTIAQQFVSDKVDAVMAIATPSAQAAYAAANGQIPVVFTAVSAPAAAGLTQKDGGNLKGVTGTCDAMPIDQSLALIQQLLPNAKNIGILHNTGEVNSDIQLNQAQELAKKYGMAIIDSGITTTNEMSSALDALLPKVDAVLNLTDNMVVSALPLEIQKCNEAKKALFGSEYTQVESGAFASAGVDYHALGRQTGAMIAKILGGTAAEQIPVETIEGAEICVNSDVAAALSVTIPDALKSAKIVTTKKEK